MEKMNVHVMTRGALRVHRSHSNLKNKTNRQSHEEHRTTNDVGNDRGRDSVVPWLPFLFFLLSIPSPYEPRNLWINLPSHLFIGKKQAFGTMAARPDELRLSHEATGSPR